MVAVTSRVASSTVPPVRVCPRDVAVASAWPDLAVAAVMAALALTAAHSVVAQAWTELQPVPVRA
jgi:hypothetical protein